MEINEKKLIIIDTKSNYSKNTNNLNIQNIFILYKIMKLIIVILENSNI